MGVQFTTWNLIGILRKFGPTIGQFVFIAIKHVPYVTHQTLRT